MSDKKYNVEYASIKDKGWIHSGYYMPESDLKGLAARGAQ